MEPFQQTTERKKYKYELRTIEKRKVQTTEAKVQNSQAI